MKKVMFALASFAMLGLSACNDYSSPEAVLGTAQVALGRPARGDQNLSATRRDFYQSITDILRAADAYQRQIGDHASNVA